MGYESSNIEDNEYEGDDSVHKQSIHQPEGIKSEDCELQDQADRRAEKVGNAKIEDET
uniref:Uncharacterized protein n=1 Tax=Peronospora matthiolae TaxID=2874970 RepID=A0AAV1UXG6_9STRA